MSCVIISSKFNSSNGVDKISYYAYFNNNIPHKGILQICHGMYENISKYDAFARFLASKGYIVCGHDHLGHGQTAYKDEDLGYFNHKNGDQCLVDDAKAMTLQIKKFFPNLPVFLMGQSMGSFVVRLYADQCGDMIDGLIVTGTSGPVFGIEAGVALTEIFKVFKGERARSQLLHKMTIGSNSRFFEDKQSDTAWLTRDSELIKQEKANSKDKEFLFSVSAFGDLFRMLRDCSKKSWGRSIPKNLPILLLSGTDDPVGQFGTGVIKVYERLIGHRLTDVSIKLYEGGRHEMLKELNRLEVYDDILNWIVSKSKNSNK